MARWQSEPRWASPTVWASPPAWAFRWPWDSRRGRRAPPQPSARLRRAHARVRSRLPLAGVIELGKALTNRIPGGLGATLERQLGEEVRHVVADRLLGQAQVRGDV